MNGHLLAVRWRVDGAEDPKPVKWVVSRLPKWLGTTSVTIGRTVRSRTVVTERSTPHVRHELRHVWQYSGKFVPWWLFKYLVWPPFKKRMEKDAEVASMAEYPVWRIIATVQTRSWFNPF
jgi:hypothetical protein